LRRRGKGYREGGGRGESLASRDMRREETMRRRKGLNDDAAVCVDYMQEKW